MRFIVFVPRESANLGGTFAVWQPHIENSLLFPYWKVYMQASSQPTSILLFHCLFDNYGVSGHWAHPCNIRSYMALPDLYAICMMDESSRPETMTAAFLFKTSVPFDSPGFLPELLTLVRRVPQLQAVTFPNTGFLPTPVESGSDEHVSEDQALYAFRLLWSEHHTQQVLHSFRISHAH
jgi:hypothetical protein